MRTWICCANQTRRILHSRHLSAQRLCARYTSVCLPIANPDLSLLPLVVKCPSDYYDVMCEAPVHALQGLTAECTDLLCRLLEVDPDKRITVQQVLKHPWFTQDMPEGMANLNSNLLQMPLSTQSGNSVGQTEAEIVQLTNTAVQGAKARQRLSFNHSGLTNSGLD